MRRKINTVALFLPSSLIFSRYTIRWTPAVVVNEPPKKKRTTVLYLTEMRFVLSISSWKMIY